MAKRIQMRKQRFLAIQKIAAEKKMQAEGPPPGDHGSKGGTMSRQGPPGRASVSIIENHIFFHNTYWIILNLKKKFLVKIIFFVKLDTKNQFGI